MAFKRKLVRKAAKRMAKKAMRRVKKYALRSDDKAGASESIVFTGILGASPPTNTFSTVLKNSTITAYHNTDISLSTFSRAVQIASNYQYFKIKYFELSIIPDFDTFIPGGPGTQGKPMFYYIIDKGNAIDPQVTNQQIKSMGAKPIALDEKPIKIRWRPAVLLSTQIVTATGATSAQMYKVSPWLNTDSNTATGNLWTPSQVCHYGIKWFAENFGGSMSYTATLTAHFAFKKPLLVDNTTALPPQ